MLKIEDWTATPPLSYETIILIFNKVMQLLIYRFISCPFYFDKAYNVIFYLYNVANTKSYYFILYPLEVYIPEKSCDRGYIPCDSLLTIINDLSIVVKSIIQTLGLPVVHNISHTYQYSYKATDMFNLNGGIMRCNLRERVKCLMHNCSLL